MAKSKKISNVLMNSKQQLDALKVAYGTSLEWVYVTIPMTYNQVKDYFGPQCEEHDPLCACCRAWVEWNTNEKKVTVSLKRDEIIDLLSK